jgi:O-antigen/teichoic acid export membrane protein
LPNIKRNLFYNFLLSCSQVLLPLVSIPYISSVLDPAGVGKVGFIDSFTYYFVTLAEFGIMVYGIREVAKEKGNPARLNEIVSELITLHIISSLCTLLLYAAGVIVLWNKIGDVRLLLFSLSFFIVNFFACDWYFMGMERFGFITLRSVIIRMLGLASIFILIQQPSDYHIYYAIIVASAIAGTIWNNFILFREIRFSWKRVNWKKHLPYVWVTYLITLFYSVPLMLDSVLLGIISSSASAVGLYVFSVKLVRTGTTLLTDSFLVFFPRVVSLSKENEQTQLQQKLLLNIRFIILFSIPMGTGLYLVADEFTHVFLGNKFLPAAENLRWLAVFPFLKGVSLFLSNPVLIAHHREKVFLRNLVAGTLLFIAAALLLGSYYADTGICMALVGAELFMVVINYVSVRRLFPALTVFDVKALVHALVGSSVFIPVVLLVKNNIVSDWGRLLVIIPVCIVLYSLFLFLVKNNLALQVKNILAGVFIKKTKSTDP